MQVFVELASSRNGRLLVLVLLLQEEGRVP